MGADGINTLKTCVNPCSHQEQSTEQTELSAVMDHDCHPQQAIFTVSPAAAAAAAATAACDVAEQGQGQGSEALNCATHAHCKLTASITTNIIVGVCQLFDTT